MLNIYPDNEIVQEQLRMRQHHLDENSCIAMVPITRAYSPIIENPCSRKFFNVSYICHMKNNTNKQSAKKQMSNTDESICGNYSASTSQDCAKDKHRQGSSMV